MLDFLFGKVFLVFFFFFFLILSPIVAQDYCPPLGPVYAAPQNLAADSSIRQAAHEASKYIDRISKNGTAGEFQPNTTSFSVNIFSAHGPESMFQYHYTSSLLNTSSTKKVDENTVYRIGSISKLITVLALLLQENKVHFDDPVTNYVPVLASIAARQEAGEIDHVAVPQWSQITIGALASQLADVARSCKLPFVLYMYMLRKVTNDFMKMMLILFYSCIW